MTSTESAAVEGRITDEDIERARAQIGIPVNQRDEAWHRLPSADGISHFAFGCGDDNPLFHDPQYGANTRWHGQIAPPTFPISTGLDQTPRFTDPERKKLFRGLFRGTGKYYAGVKWTLYKPLYADRLVLAENYTLDVQVKESEFSGGRSVKETFRYLYVDVDGTPLATRDESYINAERQGSKKSGKYSHIERQHWTEESLAEVEQGYDEEVRRGAEPQWWEDVNVGDAVPAVMKGPLTVVDVISMHMGWGWGGYGVGPLKYAHQLRKRMPAFYQPDEYGVPDVVQRLHWDAARAQALGIPAPYDYGQMRAAWASHLLTNWVGDDGWLAELDLQLRGFNYHGDIHRMTATVVQKSETPEDVISLDVLGTTQRDENTVRGTAKVLLPSRQRGAVVLPAPDEDLRRRGAGIVSRIAGQVGAEMRRIHGE
ncbi:MaoC family dehydratase N-terminal domain-containing protein [Mycobacterium sp. SMC-8]|uniref:FAS1-like dehydratase domain-containing protein n=1 Tax=Mycobacterium sp. SMC-8 TaxID=2857060 RepID=UPI0021B2D6A1|nr:MaoC family dehydratase N-terminal domain-containing protein [Mycobacterium sp. SMC-8]UXA11552.1 MaoC family dehydratase N-terminal domain-containing protein [Mycobacterium sp. SMC-8]